MRILTALLLSTTLLVSFPSPPAVAETVAITGVTLFTGSGSPRPDSTVVIRDGIVTATSPGAPVPAGARLIDGRGRTVTPGLVLSATVLGIDEVSAVPTSNDSNAVNADITVAFDPSWSINPASSLIPLARSGGVTRAAVMPAQAFSDGDHADDGGEAGHVEEPLFQGQPTLIHLGSGPDLVLRPRVGVALPLGESSARRAGGSRSLTVTALKSALDDVRHFAANEAAFNQGSTRTYSLSRADLKALLPVVRGEVPLFVAAHRAADLRLALRLAREEKLRLVLMGAEEGWMVADEIAAAGVPVIIRPTANLPGRFETQRARLDNAALLEKAGVTLLITTSGDGHYASQLRLDAGIAVAHGLPRDAALAAITSRPARLFRAAGAGAVTVGQPADLVLWSGDPLEPLTLAELVYVNGVSMPLNTRAQALAERYRPR